MSKPSYLGANVEVTSDTFTSFINKVNEVIGDMGTTVLTAAPVAQANATNGAMTTGNAHVQGVLSANTMAAQELQGGSMSVPDNLVLATNVNPKTADINIGQDGNRVNRVFTVNSNSRNLFSNTANVVTASVNALTVNVATITTESVNSLTANTAEVATGNVNSLTANVASVKTANVIVLTSNNATVNVATITTANVSTLVANNSTLEKVTANTANVNTINAGTLNTSGDTVIAGNLVVQGVTSLASNTAFAVNTSIADTLTVHSLANLNGNVVIGNTAAKTLTVNASLASNLVPLGNTYNLGSAANKFNVAYINSIPGTTFTGQTTIRSGAPILSFVETDLSDKTWFIVADGGEWSVRENDTGTTRLKIAANGSATGLTYLGQTVWTAGNDGAGSGSDMDLLDGQHGAYYLDSTNLTGTINDARLPSTMSAKTFNSNIRVDSADPYLILTETDTNTAARFVLSGGATYLQAGQANSGSGSSSGGNLYITGYLGGNIGSFQVMSGGGLNTVWHAGNDGAGSTLDADLLDGQQGTYYLNAANFTGTIADARLPTSMAGKTFTSEITGTTATFTGNLVEISGANPRLKFSDITSSAHDYYLYADANHFYILTDRNGDDAWETPHPLDLNTATNTGTMFGQTVWTSGNFDPNAKADLSGGATFTGTVQATDLVATNDLRVDGSEIFIRGAGNRHIWFQSNTGVARGILYHEHVNNRMKWQLYNTSGTYVHDLNIAENGEMRWTGGTIWVGGTSSRIFSDGNIYMSMYGDYLSNILNSKITSEGRSYPRRIGGVDLNFNWSGQPGQPNWVWGGSDGSNMYVYNPSNFNVNYAGSAGNADTVDGYHATDLCQLYKGTANNELNYPLGHIILCFTSSNTFARNAAFVPTIGSTNTDFFYQQGISGSGSALTGTWRSSGNISYSGEKFFMLRRTA